MQLRPIRTEKDYEAALREVEFLFDAQPNTPEFDRLEILSTLVEAYEKTHFSIDLPDPIEAIFYYMDTRNLSHQDLEPYFGSRSNVLEVLERKRSLTLEMIRHLHQNLGIPAEILIQPYQVLQSSA